MKFAHRAFACAFLLMTITALATSTAEAGGEFRHVVCFKFKDDATPAKVAEIEREFKALKSKIDTIVDFEWGRSENIEPLNDGYTHCFVVTFKDKKGLEVYLPHEQHQAFVALLKPHLDKVFVFDYTAAE